MEWRGVVAALANDETRRVAARLMLGESLEDAVAELSPSKQRRVTEGLHRSGMVDGHGEFKPQVFTELLRAEPVQKKTGIERFVDGIRIRQYPVNRDERGELLSWVANKAFRLGEVLTEAEVNERLSPYSEDTAVLRRYLVDYRLVERRNDGSEYALTGEAPVVPAE